MSQFPLAGWHRKALGQTLKVPGKHEIAPGLVSIAVALKRSRQKRQLGLDRSAVQNMKPLPCVGPFLPTSAGATKAAFSHRIFCQGGNSGCACTALLLGFSGTPDAELTGA